MRDQGIDVDVVVIGGGPAGATIGSLLGRHGYRALIVEKDIHPRDHVGESITPSTNPVFKEIGFLPKMEDAGFVHKPGACWTAPGAPPGKFVSLRLGEFPPPGAEQLYTYNVDRDWFDTLMLRHAYEQGAKVLQGASVRRVLFDGDRAVGVRVAVTDGWEQDIRARFVVDASGRRCLLANQLKLKRKDPLFNQFAIYSWFQDVEPNPPGFDGFLFLHFLDLERSWAWQIPMRNGITSVGVVTDKKDFQKSGKSGEEFFQALMGLNRSLEFNMRNARQIRPWWIEADYSYIVDQLAGPGWFMVGDAVRFVDPVFSTGVDIACFSAMYAFEAIHASLTGEKDEELATKEYVSRIGDGVEAWYDVIRLFYKLRNLFTAYAVKGRFREKVVRILQGNLYQPETLARARALIAIMEESYQRIMADPGNLLRPNAMIGARPAAPKRPPVRSSSAPAPVGPAIDEGPAAAVEEPSPAEVAADPVLVAAALRMLEAAGPGMRQEVDGVAYSVEEVSWPVAPEGRPEAAFACPHTAHALIRRNAVLTDVRQDYFDGRSVFPVLGRRMGRWFRFRIGSPQESGWDLHLATAEEWHAFSRERHSLSVSAARAEERSA